VKSGNQTAGFFIPALIISVLLGACAHIGSPPGGPPDKTGPDILSTTPLSDSVNITSDNKIEILFTEKVESKSVPGAVFISPRPSRLPEFKWSGKKLTIVLPDSFAAQTTYVVSLGTGIRDIRGNRMENSRSFAFSTGDKIAGGKIAGQAMKDNRPTAGITVGVFDSLKTATADFDSAYPPYMTQTGADGSYSLEYLPDGDYLLLAFEDKNNNQWLDYPAELFGLPDRIVTIAPETAVPPVRFRLLRHDTAAAAIISSTITPDHLVKIKFDRPVSSDSLNDRLDEVFLTPADTLAVTGRLEARALKEREGLTNTSFSFYFPELTDGRYSFGIGSGSGGVIGAPFDVRLDPDQTRPAIDRLSHSGRQVYPSDSVVTIGFSEPMDDPDNIASAIRVVDQSGEEVGTACRWRDRFRLEVAIDGIAWDNNYAIKIDGTDLFDLAGNALDDTIKVYSFSTYTADSLGDVSGRIDFGHQLDSTGVVYISFFNMKGERLQEQAVPGKTFRAALPPGKYFLHGYIDRNFNGERDDGTLAPFTPSETWAVYPDTVRVRARFESSGIDFLIH